MLFEGFPFAHLNYNKVVGRGFQKAVKRLTFEALHDRMLAFIINKILNNNVHVLLDQGNVCIES